VKKIIAFCSMIFVFAVAMMSVSAAGSNFSGTWMLDKAKSNGLQGPQANADSITMIVKQDDKTIAFENKIVIQGQERPAQKSTYNLDGSETTQEMTGRMTGTAKLKAKWMNEGKTLELNSVLNTNIQGNDVTITTQQHWELAEGGKVLKVHRTVDTPMGAQEATLVFNKQ